MFWRDVEQDIRTILQKLEPPKEEELLETPSHVVSAEKPLGVSDIKVSAASSIKHATSMHESPFNYGKQTHSLIRNTINESSATPGPSLSSSANQSYKIHIIKSDHLF
jgi:hypothetical protein